MIKNLQSVVYFLQMSGEKGVRPHCPSVVRQIHRDHSLKAISEGLKKSDEPLISVEESPVSGKRE